MTLLVRAIRAIAVGEAPTIAETARDHLGESRAYGE
jgi:hypothetical protein